MLKGLGPMESVAEKVKQKILLRPDRNIYIVSFPKCGRSWLSLLLSHAALQEYPIPEYVDPTNWKEIDFVALTSKLSKLNPKLANIRFTHDDVPQHKTPEELTTDKSKYNPYKVILLVRDPRDVMVSNFFQLTARDQVDWAKGLETPIDLVYSERGGLASFVRFYQNWVNYLTARKTNHLVISYEQLKTDTVAALNQIFTFADCGDAISDAAIDEAVKINTFQNVQKREKKGEYASKAFAQRNGKETKVLKARKGIVGDHKNHLTGKEDIYVQKKLMEIKSVDFFKWYPKPKPAPASVAHPEN